MKLLTIAYFLFFLQISFALMNATGVFVDSVAPQNNWINSVSDNTVNASDYSEDQIQSDNFVDLGLDTVRSLAAMTGNIAMSIISLPYTLQQLGVPNPFRTLISSAFYLIYIIGIAQFIGNRSTEGMK